MEYEIGQILSWREVGEVHRIRNGIYQRGGKLISLLTDFGKINPCYPDFHGDTTDTIFYTGAGRRGDQKLDSFNKALFNAIESKHAIPFFNKLKVGSRLRILANHSCLTAAQHSHFQVLDGEKIVDFWKIGRGW